MRDKWSIGYAPRVYDYKDFIVFIPFTTDHSVASWLLSLCPQRAMGVLSLLPLVSIPGVRTFCLSYRKQDHANIEIYAYCLIWQMAFRYKAWSHLPASSFSPVAGHSPLPCNVVPKRYLAFLPGYHPQDWWSLLHKDQVMRNKDSPDSILEQSYSFPGHNQCYR